MHSTYRTLATNFDGPILEITLNRPASHNSINNDMHQEIKEAF